MADDWTKVEGFMSFKKDKKGVHEKNPTLGQRIDEITGVLRANSIMLYGVMLNALPITKRKKLLGQLQKVQAEMQENERREKWTDLVEYKAFMRELDRLLMYIKKSAP